MVIELLLGLALVQEGEKKAPAAPGPMLRVEEVDANGDGWISAAELKAALHKLGGGKEGGPRKEGDGAKKPGPKDGEGPRKEGPRDGEAPKKPGPKEGERKDGEK